VFIVVFSLSTQSGNFWIHPHIVGVARVETFTVVKIHVVVLCVMTPRTSAEGYYTPLFWAKYSHNLEDHGTNYWGYQIKEYDVVCYATRIGEARNVYILVTNTRRNQLEDAGVLRMQYKSGP
jgi:hypothetical protein